ncbi:MAG: metallophosphoesterase [Candidatus Omnitrophota bacterium]
MLKTELISIILFLSVILFIYGLEVLLFFKALINKIRKKQTPQSKAVMMLHAVALAGILCMLYGYFVEPTRIEVKTVHLSSEKLKDSSLRLIQISDLHCDAKMRNENKLVELVNGLHPDIIVFTGDAVNTPDAVGLFQETMKALKAQCGKFAVTGNYDRFWQGLPIFVDTDFKVLKENNIALSCHDEKILMSGLNYENGDKWLAILHSLPQDPYNILLYHNSDLAEDIQGAGVDLYLSGHTHGGQFRLPFYGALVTLSRFGKKYEMGLYHVGTTTLYVNRGIGMEGGYIPRVRFLSRPEITVLEIFPKE